jgi:hypothetical protein
MSYTVELDHLLSPDELEQLLADYMPSLLTLNERYTNHIDPVNRFPVTLVYLDCLRTSWRLDRQEGRATAKVAIEGLGLAFGLLLGVCTDLRWTLATDDSGQFLTMAKTGNDPKLVSVPPFSYVAKRQEVENAEVFQHFFEQISHELIGFRKPNNWLLDGDV